MFPPERRKQKAKEHLQKISLQVENNWQYWRPIAYGLVKIDKEDFDREGPLFLMMLNAAMNYRSELETKAIKEARENQNNER